MIPSHHLPFNRLAAGTNGTGCVIRYLLGARLWTGEG